MDKENIINMHAIFLHSDSILTLLVAYGIKIEVSGACGTAGEQIPRKNQLILTTGLNEHELQRQKHFAIVNS